jgi:hypothetical protein
MGLNAKIDGQGKSGEKQKPLIHVDELSQAPKDKSGHEKHSIADTNHIQQVIERNSKLAQMFLELDWSMFELKRLKMFLPNDKLLFEDDKDKITHLANDFFSLYSAEQLAKDSQDPKLTIKQREAVTSLNDCLRVLSPHLLKIKNDVKANTF